MRAGKKAGKSHEEEERDGGEDLWRRWRNGRKWKGDLGTLVFSSFSLYSALYWLLLFIGLFCVSFFFSSLLLCFFSSLLALPCAYSFYLLFAATGLLGIGVGTWVLHGTMSVASPTFFFETVEVVVEGMVCYISILMHDISITLFNTLQVKFKTLSFAYCVL